MRKGFDADVITQKFQYFLDSLTNAELANAIHSTQETGNTRGLGKLYFNLLQDSIRLRGGLTDVAVSFVCHSAIIGEQQKILKDFSITQDPTIARAAMSILLLKTRLGDGTADITLHPVDNDPVEVDLRLILPVALNLAWQRAYAHDMHEELEVIQTTTSLLVKSDPIDEQDLRTRLDTILNLVTITSNTELYDSTKQEIIDSTVDILRIRGRICSGQNKAEAKSEETNGQEREGGGKKEADHQRTAAAADLKRNTTAAEGGQSLSKSAQRRLRAKRSGAARKIQATARGYLVRNSIEDIQEELESEKAALEELRAGYSPSNRLLLAMSEPEFQARLDAMASAWSR